MSRFGGSVVSSGGAGPIDSIAKKRAIGAPKKALIAGVDVEADSSSSEGSESSNPEDYMNDAILEQRADAERVQLKRCLVDPLSLRPRRRLHHLLR